MKKTVFEMLDDLGYEIVANNSMTNDEVLSLFGFEVNDEGEILDHAGQPTGYWFDDLY